MAAWRLTIKFSRQGSDLNSIRVSKIVIERDNHGNIRRFLIENSPGEKIHLYPSVDIGGVISPEGPLGTVSAPVHVDDTTSTESGVQRIWAGRFKVVAELGTILLYRSRAREI